MPADLSTMATLLKEDYGVGLKNQLADETPVLDLFEREDNATWEGREHVEAVHVNRNRGVYASAEGETAEDKELAAKRKSVRKELSKIAPEVDSIKGLTAKTDVLFTSIERRAIRETTKLMKEAGLPTGEKNIESMTDVLAGIIAEDIELYDDYVTSPKEAVQEAFKRFKSGFEAAAARAAKAGTQRDKTKLLALPKTHKAGGTADIPKNRVEGLRQR